MKRLDLIIDALEIYETDGSCSHGFWVDDCPNEGNEKITRQALAAARELRALEPVAWRWKDGTITTDPDRADGMWAKLYTLGESNE